MKKTIAVFMACMVVLTTLTVPSFATDYQSKYNFWNWAYDHSWFLGKAITSLADNVCTISEDGLHHATTHSANEVNADGEYTYTCVCDLCAETFTAYATDLETAYENATPDYTIDNDGVITGFGDLFIVDTWYDYECSYDIKKVNDEYGEAYVTKSGSSPPVFTFAYQFTIAVDCLVYYGGQFNVEYSDDLGTKVGMYQCLQKLVDGEWKSISPTRPDSDVFAYQFNATANSTYRLLSVNCYQLSSHSGVVGTKTVKINLPYLYYTVDSVNIDDAPISGGGSISYADDNSNNEIIENQFFDQSTNTYHNPVTDTSSTVESWNYDYSTREWTGYTENGEVKIVYGDENISVVEGGNTYNYYYTTPSSSGGNGGSAGGDGSDGGESIWDKLGELLGTLLGGLIDLITGVVDGLLDSLINLVKTTLEKLGQVVDLFGSFGDALSALWTWLPEDIVTILTAGVSVVVFASVIKLFI